MKITYSSSTSENPTAYLTRSFRTEEGKSTTDMIEHLGTLEEIKERYGCEDPRQWCKDYAKRMTAEEKKE